MLLLLLGQEYFPVVGEYYVSIDSIESIEGGRYRIIFDGIKSAYFDVLRKRDFNVDFEELVPYIIYLDIDKSFYDSFFPNIRSRNFTGKWFKLETTEYQTNFPANISVVDSETPEFSPVFIKSISYYERNEPIHKELSGVFSFKNFERSNSNKIEKHLDNLWRHPETIHKLNVYNVGQGSLAAVTDENNLPLFYFDLGGAWWIFPKSYPTSLKLCFSHTKTVIISHWDLDHIETARRLLYNKSNSLSGISWIAPKQTISPYYLKIAAKMKSTGRLLLWSGNQSRRINFWAGALLKCNGPDKNHSGLALLVESKNNTIEKVLHPGDAAYQHIPGFQKINLDGLVATHHGANFDVNNSPIPQTTDGAIAYSHGNKYGHPTAKSVSDHHNAGWTGKRETFAGKISIGGNISFTKKPCHMKVPCLGSKCDLTISQIF